ncbi:MAG: hypothetical protein J5449_08455 [Oscillospiraceae bacterium]|nr:hypothetical protein [Oscillospiraceae bacterium]
MRIQIHRGTHQIGGSVTEITSDDTRVFIDFGSELPGADGVVKPETLSVPGVTEGEPRCDAVFFTHTHGDHIGQLDRIHPSIPLYMGATARELCLCLNRYLADKGIDRAAALAALERANTFTPAHPITVGSIRVTPFLIDHSAFDAYMFLIEADGKRVLHTGDFRGHGFRGKALIPMLEKYVGQVDWLVCEGTMLSRSAEQVKTEHELQRDERDLMKQYKRVFVLCSSMNIDRIAGFAHAVPDGRAIICDDFQRKVLDVVQTRHGQVPLYDFSRVKSYDRTDAVLNRQMMDDGFLCFIRANHFGEKMLDYYGDDAVIAYSMWDGYLSEELENKKLTALLKSRNWVKLHTSGHATPDTIKAVCETVRPRCGVIPMHSECPEAFKELFPGKNVILLKDGELLEL